MHKPINKTKTAILGAGLSGLTLGYLLSQKGIDFEVLEENAECGGLMRTLQNEGFSFDYCGSHIIFSKNQETLNFMLSLLESNKVKNKRQTKVLYNNCLVKYPFENGLNDLSKRRKLRMLKRIYPKLAKQRERLR